MLGTLGSVPPRTVERHGRKRANWHHGRSKRSPFPSRAARSCRGVSTAEARARRPGQRAWDAFISLMLDQPTIAAASSVACSPPGNRKLRVLLASEHILARPRARRSSPATAKASRPLVRQRRTHRLMNRALSQRCTPWPTASSARPRLVRAHPLFLTEGASAGARRNGPPPARSRLWVKCVCTVCAWPAHFTIPTTCSHAPGRRASTSHRSRRAPPARSLDRRARIAARDAHPRELDAELGKLLLEGDAQARAWADRRAPGAQAKTGRPA